MYKRIMVGLVIGFVIQIQYNGCKQSHLFVFIFFVLFIMTFHY